MPLRGADYSSTAIVHRIREVVSRERTLTFTTLTTTLPDCQWINLLRALNHLKEQHEIRLIPLPRDYQISSTAQEMPEQRTD